MRAPSFQTTCADNIPRAVAVHTSRRDNGPGHALPLAERKSHNYIQTTAGLEAAGCHRQMVSTLRIKSEDHPNNPDLEFPCEFDLGSNDIWFFGCQLLEKGTVFGVPGKHQVRIWFPLNKQKFAEKHIYRVEYGDGSSVAFTTWGGSLRVKLSPNAPWDFGGTEQYLPLQVGVAHDVHGGFAHSVVSGIVGLGRRMEKADAHPASFLEQIRDKLVKPRIVILMSPLFNATF
ncbi:hypothetical protein B0H12DRAFT_1131532 [Mycena haematopus]|nr:hypothetical protein B0H12DRAFT_1131532 [Mycena haematopus]